METLSPQEQIGRIEQEYQREAAVPGHEAMSRVVEGHIQEQIPEFKAAAHAPRTMTESLPPEAAETVQGWINTVFSHGLSEAIKAAKQSGDMALIDAFHGALSGQLYNSLVERGKVEPIS
ncbi:MAG TPA: hypothetical protein VG941_02510 [Candidatus Paceibacterota bacterium]|nr:hypothetical protein [Candidatus Paceibacterota bacterium]